MNFSGLIAQGKEMVEKYNVLLKKEQYIVRLIDSIKNNALETDSKYDKVKHLKQLLSCVKTDIKGYSEKFFEFQNEKVIPYTEVNTYELASKMSEFLSKKFNKNYYVSVCDKLVDKFIQFNEICFETKVDGTQIVITDELGNVVIGFPAQENYAHEQKTYLITPPEDLMPTFKNSNLDHFFKQNVFSGFRIKPTEQEYKFLFPHSLNNTNVRSNKIARYLPSILSLSNYDLPLNIEPDEMKNFLINFADNQEHNKQKGMEKSFR